MLQYYTFYYIIVFILQLHILFQLYESDYTFVQCSLKQD